MTTRKGATGELRRRAEQALRKSPAPDREDPSRLLHELEVHQVELELQNEELRGAREAMEAALERYTEVFDYAPIGYATLATDGSIREINYAGARLFGTERGRLIGQRFAGFVEYDGLEAFGILMRDAVTTAGPRSAELAIRSGARSVPVRMTAAMLRRGDSSVLLTFEDISERKAHEAELARSEEALREAGRRKDEFLAMLSHELRNPLSPIRTSVFVLDKTLPADHKGRQALGVIDRSSAHLTRLLDDLLDVTRFARGKVALRREPVDLVALLQRTLADHAEGFAEHQIMLDTRIAAGELWVDGDPARLVQVFTNVLGNAQKFTPPGGAITVAAEHAGDLVLIRFRDTGVGIAPELLGVLFEPFVQGPQALDREGGGLGLGLAMVRSLIELHGGQVAIQSQGSGQGTDVTIWLPRTVAPSRAAGSGTKRETRCRRVLIIEDKPDAANTLKYALSLSGHVAEVAYDGKVGIELARQFKPHVVFCDLGLPGMDGYSVAAALRRLEELRDVYLVALSGYARPEDVARAIAAGFDRHLAKPAPLEELEQLVATAP